MTYTFYKLGARFSGPCFVCKKYTGSKPYELAETLIYMKDKTFVVAHARCVGAITKSKIGGGLAFRTAPPDTVEE